MAVIVGNSTTYGVVHRGPSSQVITTYGVAHRATVVNVPTVVVSGGSTPPTIGQLWPRKS